ncbi:MAG: adenylyl-sulfate kinase [Bacteroidales bacterium]|nr:adenylyl-sulfate kinase [Bacteroidales bacterium]
MTPVLQKHTIKLLWIMISSIIISLIVYLFIHKVSIVACIGVIDFLLKSFLYFLYQNKKKRICPRVYWFTGLSGAGKSTLSEHFYQYLKDKGVKVEHLDGDYIRNIFPKIGFTKDQRIQHIKRVAFLASKLQQNGITVIASFITPYNQSRDYIREVCSNYIEIYVSTPIEECERRDVKGLYKKARRGEISNFTGIDDPFEIPKNPEIIIDTTNMEIEDSVKQIIKFSNKI